MFQSTPSNRTQRRAEDAFVRKVYERDGRRGRRRDVPIVWTPWVHVTRNEYPTMPSFVTEAWKNNHYVVQASPRETAWGEVVCLMIRRNDAAPIRSWVEMQRIKNSLVGPERVAVEVYPAESKLIDAANMYHLWVLPAGFQLPFSL